MYSITHHVNGNINKSTIATKERDIVTPSPRHWFLTWQVVITTHTAKRIAYYDRKQVALKSSFRQNELQTQSLGQSQAVTIKFSFFSLSQGHNASQDRLIIEVPNHHTDTP